MREATKGFLMAQPPRIGDDIRRHDSMALRIALYKAPFQWISMLCETALRISYTASESERSGERGERDDSGEESGS